MSWTTLSHRSSARTASINFIPHVSLNGSRRATRAPVLFVGRPVFNPFQERRNTTGNKVWTEIALLDTAESRHGFKDIPTLYLN